jgi:tripeptide aminopeptidase
MGDYFIEHPEGVEMINKAYLASKLKLQYEPIRGGTDGAMITYMGLPCPNLGTGGANFHGRYEYVVNY